MTGQRAISWFTSTAIAMGSLVLFNSSVHADDSATTQPAADVATTQPIADTATTQPAPQPASVTPEARQLLDQVKQAYAGLKSLDISGNMTGDFDIDGEQDKPTAEIKATFVAGGKFRNELKDDDDFVVGFTGQKQYCFLQSANDFIQFDSPAGKVDLTSINSNLAGPIRKNNISLALALAPDAAAELVGKDISMALLLPVASNAAELLSDPAVVSRTDDVTLDNTAYPTLLISQKAMDMTLSFDPRTHLIRRQSYDLTKLAKLKGGQDVREANVAIDFKNIPDAKVADDQFAWAPPEGAQEVHQHSAAPEDGAAEKLKGHSAPAFVLEELNGRKIDSAKLKGSVYILDFWATWCDPCVHALPGLDQLYKDEKAAGLRVFAINQQEDKDTVAKFVKQTNLSIPVLLDEDGKVNHAYGADEGIPETVLIGRDGKIIEVFVGTSDKQEAAIRAATIRALKGL